MCTKIGPRIEKGNKSVKPRSRLLCIFTIAFDMLVLPRRVRARKRRKASVTKRRNTAPGFNTHDPKKVAKNQ